MNVPAFFAPELILRDNHYGWFDRVRPGYHPLSPKGRDGLELWSTVVVDLIAT